MSWIDNTKDYWSRFVAWVGAHAVISSIVIVALVVATVVFMVR